MRGRKAVALALLLAPLLAGQVGGDASADVRALPSAYKVIVDPANPLANGAIVDRKFLEDAFLKKLTRWPNGDVIRPVDLGPDSPVRRRFSEEVLERSVSSVKSYWQRMIFSGRDVPPPELDSDAEVVKYVVGHPGAVGYVWGGAETGATRVVAVK